VARGELIWTFAHGFPHERAIADHRRAMAINPSDAEGYIALGRVYQHVGLLEGALEVLQRAARLDPGSDEAARRITLTHYFRHDYPRVVANLQRFDRAYAAEAAAVLDRTGQAQEAARVIRRELSEPATVSSLASARAFHAVLLARAGDRRGAEEQIRLAEGAARNPDGYSHMHHPQYELGRAHAALGDNRAAVEWLRRAAGEGFPCYPFYAGDPYLAPLKGDPGFESCTPATIETPLPR
jgi:tetratricopeptide (TPR) repeat protein